MAGTSSSSGNPIDPLDHLPLSLLVSEIVPPAPNRSSPDVIDWLLDFAGCSWVAYGASSLLVISHLPSPSSSKETILGPILRQVLELSSDDSSSVTGVSWSPATPSTGELAAASGNCIFIFSHDSASSLRRGSFCWSQNAVLVQSTTVQAIKWTGSGDGIISGGIEVVLWKRKNKSWEIAWKFKRDHPQNLVSATWSIEGPCATACCPSISHEEHCGSDSNKCILVCYSDGKPQYATAELHHPQPVSMIQWRPPIRMHLEKDVKIFVRHVLLTCCLDGSARLWTEIDSGKARKPSKDYADHEIEQQSFCLAVVIEMNHTLNCTLGTDVFLIWATEIGGIFKTTDGASKFFPASGYEHDKMDRCEWLIGFGPKMLVTFWAIHYLDDISPVRSPHVTLWKRLDLQDLNVVRRTGFSDFRRKLLLSKVVISRNYLSAPPNMCSLIHLLPCNSLYWSQLYAQPLNDTGATSFSDSRTSNFSLCSEGGLLNLGGHTGKILQVSLHPNVCEVDLAVSLDSSGLVLFWSLSTIPNCTMGQTTLVPRWKLCGNLATQDSCLPYTSLRWAPSISSEDRVLLMGHIGGIDCFVVKISRSEDVLCHYICTIPFTGHGPYEDGPTKIFTIPLPSTCNKTFKFNKFMLLSVWEKGFKALSWEIVLHSYDTVAHCHECSNFSKKISGECRISEFETTFGGKRFCLGILCCSSQLPEPHNQDHITSFAVLSPGNLTCIQTNSDFMEDLISNEPAYVMATGCFDGSLKLWRSNSVGSSALHVLWELVGKFVAHQGPVSAICLTDCGRKIATCMEGSPDCVSSLRIWDSVHLTLAGSFRLEDTLSVSKGVVALNWLSLGNGQLFLGVSSQKKLQVYAQRHSGCQILLNPGYSLKSDTWLCVAVAHTVSAIFDFLWGPRATAIVVHENFFSIFSEWLFLVDSKNHATCYAKSIADKPLDCYDGTVMENLSAVFTDCNIDAFGKLSIGDSSADCNSRPLESNTDHLSCSMLIAQHELKLGARTMLGLWSMLEVEQKLRGSLPIYHPGALFMNIFSGNWKRAYLSVRHLVEYLVSNCFSETNCDSAKFSCVVPHILLSNYYEGIFSKTSTDERFQWRKGSNSTTSSLEFDEGFNQFACSSESYGSSGMLSSHPTKSELSGFVEPIEKFYTSAALTIEEKMQLLAIIDLLGEISNPQSASAYENLDEAGRRFWVRLRFQQLYFFRRFEVVASIEELVVDSALIGWAFHSDCQETLFDSFLPNEPSWQQMRALGVGYWFTNVTQLRTRMEKLARLQYLKRKDPKECALLYIALNRIQVLAGLFKISKDEKDKPLVGFLTRNFQEEKNKAAAIKNAYVLMGRHQFQLAIAFFLLAGDTPSAISVCAKNLKDEQLAMVICRLIEGHGGPSEHHFLTKFMLPSAIERGDNWLASLLEWVLGNYFKSFLSMLGLQESSIIDMSAISANHVASMDPSIGLYCLTLLTKNSMRNAIGERNAAIFCRWANLMIASALNRCGLPLEALESLSTSLSTLENTDQGNASDTEAHQTLPGILKFSASNSFNWLSSDVALHLESHAKLNLAVQYLSELMREHPSFPDPDVGPAGVRSSSLDSDTYRLVIENFRQKLFTALALFERRFSLAPSSLLRMILVWLCHNGLAVIGYGLLVEFISEDPSQGKSHQVDSFLHPLLQKPLLKATEDISLLFSRFIVICGISSFQLKPCYTENDVPCGVRNPCIDTSGLCVRLSLRNLRAALRSSSGYMTEDVIMKPLFILDLFEYYLEFASAWLHRNPKSLFLVVEPILITLTNGHTPYEVNMVNLRQLLLRIPELVCDLSIDDMRKGLPVLESITDKKCEEVAHSISEDEKWHVIGVCLWQHMYNFLNHQLQLISIKIEDSFFSSATHEIFSLRASGPSSFESDSGSIEETKFCCFILAKLLKTSLELISYYHLKRLALILQQKGQNGFHIAILQWLGGSSTKLCRQPINQSTPSVDVRNNNDDLQVFDILWDRCADPNLISKGFEHEKIDTSHFLSHKSIRNWIDIYKSITEQHGSEKTFDHQVKLSSSPASGEFESPVKGLFQNALSFLNFWQKDTTPSNGLCYFRNPKEICRRNGELLEAICVNSIDERQVALASNRKGIIFFNWDDGMPVRDQSDYIWPDNWRLNGWPDTESSPVQTFVSPGIDLGSKKGARPGLGGATTGRGTSASTGRNLTSSGAVEIPGFAGVSASGFGGQIQEDFKEFLDPPATVENISTRAFSSHPLRPFFLVGSINTHIYLWEFGKDRATATYGVLPAANVPPPYALASISALQFDLCGDRFATAAVDGTVSTWHLEVGGRGNTHPTESSLCFNSHALDVTYVTSSGSVVAAAGYSSTGANVAIWDTLAPPTTSRASIICHEGGARSISVFDNDIGSGSVSPLIVTGGKGGDVRLHDLRYIVTGKSRHFDNGELSTNSSANANTKTHVAQNFGEQNQNGMLWYIPKAHLGSVTKVATIPNTSLFLTGSEDRDVKLWDAKTARLVYHWPKMHERHTFLQPSSHGFGGVVRAAVTDIQIVSNGFLTCGGDGSVSLVQFENLSGT